MMRWVSDVMDFVCRALALLMQLAGFAGLLLAILVGLWAFARKVDAM